MLPTRLCERPIENSDMILFAEYFYEQRNSCKQSQPGLRPTVASMYMAQKLLELRRAGNSFLPCVLKSSKPRIPAPFNKAQQS